MRKSFKKSCSLVKCRYPGSLVSRYSSHSSSTHNNHNSNHSNTPSSSSHFSPSADPHKAVPSSHFGANTTTQHISHYDTGGDFNAQKPHYEVVIVGGGAGGLSILNSLRDQYKGRIAIIDPSPYSYYQPGWTLVGAGLMTIGETFKPLNIMIPSETAWLPFSATSFDPESNSVNLSNNTKVTYTVLLVATGFSISLDSTPGLKEALDDPECPVACNYSFPHVTKTYKLTRAFRGGTAVFTQPKTPIKCGGAPQKAMYLADAFWQYTDVEKRFRRKTQLKFMTGIGKLFSCDHYVAKLNEICDEKGIERTYNTVLSEVRGKRREAVFKTATGAEQIVKFDFLHVTPEMKVGDVVRKSPLANKDGFIDVDINTLQHKKYNNIFAIGDCAGLPTSRTASAVAAQSGAVRKNMLAFLQKEADRPQAGFYDGYTACPIPTGYGKLLLCEFDYSMKPRETFWFDQRKESLLLYYLKKNWMPKLYWDYLLKGRWEGPGFISMFTNPRNWFKKRDQKSTPKLS